ncbi:MAG TPA: DUF6252 family protein [Flavobacterium sp.]|jgi:hypothetical protein
MKKLNTFKTFGKAGIIATALFFAAACSDDDNNSSGTGGGTDSFIEGKVDGTQFNNLEIQGNSVAVATTSGTGDARLIMISGSDMSQNTMSVIMLGIDAPGTYPVNPDTDTVLAYLPGGTQESYDTSNCSNATGTLTITTINDTKVEGTFEFTGKVDENCAMSKEITSGSFRGVFLQAEN